VSDFAQIVNSLDAGAARAAHRGDT